GPPVVRDKVAGGRCDSPLEVVVRQVGLGNELAEHLRECLLDPYVGLGVLQSLELRPQMVHPD
ncbi:unnamed protein product, partial [Discosporangium mesarthrocarpum]